MKRKSTILRMLALLALLLPWTLQAQNAKVSEYDGSAATAAYTSIAGTSGATAWTQGDYVDVSMPFAMYFGENQIASGSTLRVYPDGSASFTSLAGSRIAPLYYSSGYSTTATSIYTKSSAQQLVVEWRKVVSGQNSYSFQLKLYPGGDIEFCYGPMTISSSINVLVGMMSSDEDIYRVGGANGGSAWDTITRYTSGTTTRTLSSTYAPAYDAATGQGVVYTFTQPACVKPTSVTATALAWNSIQVDWTVSSTGTGFEVKYSADPAFDPNTGGAGKTINNGSATSTTITVEYGGTPYYIYVRKICNGTPSGWSQMATVTTLPGCYSANWPLISSEGVVTWTSPNDLVTSYNLKYGLAGFDPATEGTAVNNISALTYTLPLAQMAGATTYDVYISTNCSASGVTTDWVGPVSFNTPCAAQNVPYSTTLADYAMPSCWSEDVLAGDDSWGFYNGYASFTYTPDASSRLVSPVFNLSTTGEYQVEFDHAEPDYMGTCDSLWLYYRTSATAEWVRLAQYGNHSSTMLHETVLLPNPTPTYQLAFVSYGMDGNSINLANVTVKTQPTCKVPSNLAITGTSGNSVTLSWNENGTATAWQIAYGLFTTDDDYTIVDATTNPFTVTGLGLGEWHFFVRSNCAANDQSDWFGSVSQTFGYCIPAPTSHDNNGITKVTFGNTMVVNDNTATTSASRYQNHSDMIGDVFAGAEAEVDITLDAGYTYGTKIWIDWNNDFTFSNDEQVFYVLAPNNRPYTVNATFTVPVSTPLGDYRMRIGATDNDSGPDACYTGTYGVMRDYTIRVVAAPSCFKPNSLAVSGVTSTAATLTWVEAGLSTQWEVKLGARGFNPDEEGTSYIVNGTPTLALDYLYMVTDYDAYVRAICDPEGPTDWSNVCEFRTFCPNGGSATMGTGTTATSGVIVNSSWGNTYCQQIFTAAELAAAGLQAGNIAGMTFTWNGNGSYQKDFSIYLGNTTQENFSSTTSWVPIASQTLVYGPTLRPTTGTAGEQEYTFTTPFAWDGTSNIVVSTFINQHGGNQSSSGFNSYSTNSGTSNMSMWKYRDNSAFTESEVDGLTASSRSSYRASIKFIAPCDTGSCNAPTTAIALSETEYAATLTFTDVNEETNPTYGIVYGPQGFDPTAAGTTVSPITTGSYTISNLVARTSYDVYVYAICSGTNGRMVKYNFVTPFIPNCKTPVIDGEYGASNITYNTATLTWRQPGDQPMFWTVRYADVDFNPATAAATDYTELTVQGTAGATAQLTGLVAGTTYYVYIKATCATAPDLDESPWLSMSNANPAYTFTTPACVTPTAVAATQVTNSTAMISWTSNATAWTVKYGPASFDPDNEGTAVSATTASIELTGLDAYTYYDVYVKANCTATDESDWSAAATFRTSCPDGGDATLGNGTYTSAYVPVHYNWGNTYCQQIFTAQELTEAGMSAGPIQGISFSWYYRSSYTKEFTIYIGTTDKDEFNDNSDWITVTGDPVYGPAEFATSAAQENFAFNTPFVWDGASNIVVTTIMNQYGGSGTGGSGITAYAYDAGYNRSLYNYRDSYAFVVNDPETSGSQHKGISNYRANITFMANCNADVTCFAPASVSATVAPDNTVAVTWTARTDLRPVVNNFEMKYGLAGFNPDNSGTLVPNLNNVFNYNITAALDANTDYEVAVRTVCGEGEGNQSKWTKAAFHTYPSCWAPSALAVTATSQNSATLSWTENTPTAATRWEVVYGLPGFDPDRATPVETTNNTGFELTGLNHTTKYEFYVRAVCSATDRSLWSNVATGTTQCGIWQYADMPLVENFDGVTGTTSSTINNHVLPNCWDYINTSTTTSGTSSTGYPGYPIAYNGASTSYSGSNHMRFYTYTTAAYGDQYAILPQFGFSLDTVVVGFYARESSTTTTYVGNIEVGVMSDPDDASTFVAVGTVQPTTTSYEYFEVDFSEYAGTDRYIALKAVKPTSGYNVVYVDDLTVKLREKVNSLDDAGETIVACNEFVMADTTNGGYHGGLNATYVVRPAEAGKVAHLTGSYNLENGYDFLSVYRGAANANNLVGRYTGNGPIDYVTTSNLWADSGYFTLVLTTDADNAFAGMEGFKLLVSCECPQPAADVIAETQEANGTYTWRNGTTYNNNVVRTGLTYDATAAGVTEGDRQEVAEWTYVNVAGCDSVSYSLNLTVHPTYNLTYNAQICERDTFLFYGQKFAATGTYTVALTSQYGADSIGILNLQVNPAPLAYIYSNNRQVSAIDAYCDGVDLALEARSNNSSATFEWEDESTAANRIVNPHESNTYTVIAVNPTTTCTSLPATLTVTTVPVPELSISGDAEICYGESTTLTLADANNVEATYRWSNGATGTSITVNPSATTTYTVTATTSNASACTATASLEVVVNALPVVTATASVGEICRDSVVTLTATQVEGYSYSWNTGAATAVATTAAATTGAYTVTVTDQNGCQNEFQTSTVTVYPSYELNDTLLVCYTNNPYTWGAQTITANGNYDQNFTIAHGCDSLVHLAFTFEQMGVQNSNRELCEGTVFTFGEGIYQQSYTATENTVITYIDTTSGDCPVQMNLNLTVNHPAATAIEQTVCDSYTWPVSGQTYTESGAYPYTLATTKGCDSVVTLNLTVNYQNTGVETVTACDNYVWDLNGVNYTATTNEPTFTLQNQWGCDSVVTLDLTVNYRSYHEDFHCVRDAANFTWIDGETYNLDVNVTDGIEYVTGENAVGCNEIAQLHLVLNPIINTLNWITVDTCDEYEIPNAVVFDDENDCQGHIESLFISESGDYEVRTRPDADVYGQDELTRVHLTINQSSHHTTVVTACLPYEWLVNVGTEEAPVMYSVATITADMVNGASVYNMSYEMPQQYSNGCSSIEVLRLTPKYPSVETIEATICQNGSWTAENDVTYYGNMLNVGENLLTWDNTELNADGCPLEKKVNLTVNPVYNETAELTFCESEFALNAETGEYELTVADANHDGAEVVLTIPGALNEVAYTNSVVANWQTALGCDSSVTIEYTVNPTTVATETYTVCYKDNFEWDANGETYGRAGNYVDTVVIANEETGCTLNRVLNLTVLGTYVFEADTNVCTTYEGPDGVTYRETRTFDVPYVGTYDETQYCDAVTRLTYVIHQSALNHQYVVSNRPYTWKNGQTFSQSVENVYYDVPIGEGCDSVLALHFTMVDPITFCDDAFPYETGINDIAINTSDIVMDTASFCLDNSYAGSIGGPSNLNWGIKFEANRPNDKYKVYGAQLYYVGIPGAYSLRIYTGGDAAPATLVGTKTITFSDGETTGWKYFELDEPLNIDNSNLWVTFHGDDLGYPISCVQYYDENDQNGAWVSTDGTYWESLNSNNNSLFYSFMIKTVYSANIWRNNDPQGNDTILYYTVNPTYNDNFDTVVCDSYVWDGTTYTESGVYTNEYTSVNGCDSTVTMNVTIKNSTAETVTVAVCDSYTWADGDGETYTESGNYEWTTTNEAGCDSVVTLALTVNVNAGVEQTETACAEYTWNRTGLTYTNSTAEPVVNDYTVTYADANGCTGDSVLHLTLNPVNETTTDLVVNEAASYTYLGVMYTAPYDGIIDHTFQNQYGCDSIDHLHLVIPVVADDHIVEVNVEACGSYTWEAPDGTGHTYEWMSMSDRQSHGMAMYRDVTANQYVYTYPTDTTFDAAGVMTTVRVLHLNLLEATYSTETLNVPASLGSYTIDGDPDDVTVTFNLDSVGTPIVRTLGVGSVAYCNDYRTYTINIIDNYDTTEVYACADEATYEWNGTDYTIGTPGHTYWFSQVENAGTLNELVHVLKVNQRAVNAATATATACDTYTWTDGDGLTYTTSGTYVYNYTDENQCAATKTLTLTVNYNSNTAYTDAACDTYTWTRNNQTYTATGDYTYNYNTAEGCASTDTLHLTINSNSNETFTKAACNSYVWAAAEGGDGLTYTTSGTYTYNYTADNGCPSVNTLNLTINLPTNSGETVVACDSIEWNGTMYYTSGNYEYDYTTAAGCASTDTLHLTVNAATHNSETTTQCDSYVWNGTTYTATGDYMYTYNNAAGCPSVDTLHLTINVNTSTINDTIVACDEYTWAVNNRLYNTSGDYTARTTDANGCATTNTLNLTVNRSSSYDSVLYVSDGSYRYTYQDQHQELFGEGVYNLTEMYTNEAGCDSTLNITLNIGTALLGIDNVVNCNSYTWRNGETYVYIDAAERAANLNADNVAPLYKTNTGTYVYYNPTYTVAQDNGFDSIYMLALTLTQSYLGNDEVTLNISDRTVTYGDSTFVFNSEADMMQDFVNEDREFDVHFGAVQYCDSIITLTVHLVNNYQEVTDDAADICVSQESFTWRDHTISTATTDYDNVHTYYVYDTLATGIIEYITVTQHPITYTTERRTACDSYTWYGTEYTESTSNATMYLPAGTEVDGETLICDRVATLILVINHNTSTTYDVASCENYIWSAANGGNGDTLTESGTYTYDYETAAGCPSTNTLNLTINHNTSTEYTVDACDSYTWAAEEGGNGTTYTTASPAEGYTYDYLTDEGCPSTNTLHLTIRNNSNETFTETACDSYTWSAEDGGDGETYTTSGVYTYDYEAENGCPSTNTLNLTINENSSTEYTVAACDSYTWNGTEYTVSGDYTYDYADANNCASEDVLHLTINASTHNAETVVACQTYTWHGNVYSNPSSVGDMFYGTYEFSYVNEVGCYSVDTLHLTLGGGRTFATQTVANCGPYTWIVNGEEVATLSESIETSTSFLNPRTGCDSMIFLYLTVFEAPVNNIDVTICDSELPYTWTNGDNTTVLNEAGVASVTYPFSVNCDSTVRLTLTVNPTKATALTDQICLGNSYNANGFVIAASELPAAGEYTFTQELNTYLGCDSIVTLTLTVGDVINNPVEAVACDTYDWTAGDGETYTYTASGTYSSEPYANAAGCTTVDVLTLTINVNAGTEYTETVCDAYMWNGTQYTESGDYTYDYTDGNGCASTDVLHLTVNNSAVNTIEKTVCDSYTWENGDGQTYTTSGVYTYNYTTSDGCSGTDYLVLTVNTNSNTEYTATACDTYTWNNVEYTESGDYTYEYTNAAGCPSTDVLHLTVNKSTHNETTATACDSYNWYNTVYTESGDYTYEYINNKGCASVDVLHLTVNSSVVVTIDTATCGYFTWNGVTYDDSDVITHHFTAANGCDSTEIINLTVNGTAFSTQMATACDSYTWDVNGETYTTGGDKIAVLDGVAANGCDSTITLVLTLNHNTNSSETVAACDSYTWNGQVYTTSGDYTYDYTADNGCASTDTLHLTVNNNANVIETASACEYYLWNGNAYTESGSYSITLQTVSGCDSTVTLNLTIGNAVNTNLTATACESYTWNGTTYTTSGIYTNTYSVDGGCDSTVTLALTINQPKTSTLSATACESYIWNGTNYTASGNYTQTYTAANGCDSVVTLALTVNQPAATSFTATACESYTWNGATYTTSGSYTQNYTTVNGCDSVVTLNLTITPAIQTSVYQTSCNAYTWNGTTYTTSGNYTYTYTSASGCDSIVTLHLTVTPAINMTFAVTACDSYTWNGTAYTTSGNYTDTFTAVGGCDSVVTLVLTVNNSTTGTTTEEACENYTWYGQTYTTSGNYTHTLTAANGCDSVVTLALTVNHGTTGIDNQTACGSYTWIDGQTYTSSTDTPTYTLTAANGCDSVVTLNLTVNYSYDIIDEVAACDSYIWIDNVNYTESTNTPNVVLTAANGCDSVITLNLTINHSVEIYDTIDILQTQLPYDYNGNSITAAGDYVYNGTTASGCDSTVYLHVNVQAVAIDVVGSLDDINIYPNPTRGRVTVTADEVVKVEVLDIVGRLVATFENTNTFDISNLGEGAYTLRITLPNGTTVRKVVKK